MKLISITILSLLISFTTINNDKKPLLNQETTGLNIGNTAPELDFKDPNGKNIKFHQQKTLNMFQQYFQQQSMKIKFTPFLAKMKF